MKRWLPFVVFILFIFVLVIFLLFSGQSDQYIPATSDPVIVYKEACARCHGEQGEGEGILYPDLSRENLDEEDIFDIVRNGEFFMPSFPHIPDSTLRKLTDYVSNKKFTNE